MSKTKHIRFLAEVDILDSFIPRKDGFETEERDFVYLEDLQKKVKLLQNSSGDKLLDIIKKTL